jgi:hypothetical protein
MIWRVAVAAFNQKPDCKFSVVTSAEFQFAGEGRQKEVTPQGRMTVLTNFFEQNPRLGSPENARRLRVLS